MTTKLESLDTALSAALSEHILAKTTALGEITVVASPENYLHVARTLRDHPDLRFEQMMDLCGVDYYNYGMQVRESQRFAAVVHLLSISNNVRVRLRVFASDDEVPVLPSLVDVWPSANWFEREAFDLYGIIFEGHPDLRRILTDYGFIGHPFRRDFPVYGNVEMRYDPEQKRVIYQPVTIAAREIIPRVIREEGYGGIK